MLFLLYVCIIVFDHCIAKPDNTESNRISKCRDNVFLCEDAHCTNMTYVCDGNYECTDGSDERYCGHKRNVTYDKVLKRSKRASGQYNTYDCGLLPNDDVLKRAGVPWHAGIYNKTRPIYRQFCGGTLVSTRVVISATSCFCDEIYGIIPASQLVVAVGSPQRTLQTTGDLHTQISDVIELLIPAHNSRANNTAASDIALLILATKIRFSEYVTPACLDLTSEIFHISNGTTGKISGWGFTEKLSLESMVKFVDVSFIHECPKNSSKSFVLDVPAVLVSDDKICTSFNKETQLCDVDIGTGLLFPASHRVRQRYYLRGVLSAPLHSRDECINSFIAEYTPISNYSRYIAYNMIRNYSMPSDSGCGVPPSQDAIKQGVIPWHAAIYSKTENPYKLVCGGTLISATVVISGAHCFWDYFEGLRRLATQYAVAVGKSHQAWDDKNEIAAQKSDVERIELGSKLSDNSTNYKDGITLLFLITKIVNTEYVRPVCVSFEFDFHKLQLQLGNIAVMSGWGADEKKRKPSNQMKLFTLTIVDMKECLTNVPPGFRAYISAGTVCATFENNTKLCVVDSGSGLTILDEYRGTQRYYLRGVVTALPRYVQRDATCSAVDSALFTWSLALENPIANYVDVVDTSRSGYPEEQADTRNCGIVPLYTEPLSIGGRSANYSEIPWHTGIYRKLNSKKGIVHEQICGGSLISTTLILSAAHCFANDVGKRRNPKQFAVAIGKFFREWDDPREVPGDVQKSNVSAIHIPDNFLGSLTRFQSDIAVVRAATPFQFKQHIVPVCLDFDLNFDNEQLKGGSFGKVSGWGYTTEQGDASPFLKVLEEPIYNSSECFSTIPAASWDLVTTDKFCGGYVNGIQALCKGDSGGGLVVPAKKRGVVRYYLRGIVSTASTSVQKCNKFSLTYFTRVRVHQYLITKWLQSQNNIDNLEIVSSG